jgi:uncharacterized protein YjaG (DUF416 family)
MVDNRLLDLAMKHLEMLKSEFRSANSWRAKALAIGMAEILLPYYQRFCRDEKSYDKLTLRRLLDALWQVTQGSVALKPISGKSAYDIAPDTEDHESHYTFRATQACIAVGLVAEKWGEGRDCEIEEVLGSVFEVMAESDGRVGMSATELQEYNELRDLVIGTVLELLVTVALTENDEIATLRSVEKLFKRPKWIRAALLL